MWWIFLSIISCATTLNRHMSASPIGVTCRSCQVLMVYRADLESVSPLPAGGKAIHIDVGNGTNKFRPLNTSFVLQWQCLRARQPTTLTFQASEEEKLSDWRNQEPSYADVKAEPPSTGVKWLPHVQHRRQMLQPTQHRCKMIARPAQTLNVARETC